MPEKEGGRIVPWLRLAISGLPSCEEALSKFNRRDLSQMRVEMTSKAIF